jgi:hypothetical protein
MLSQARKQQYSYLVAYDREVGSSWDPALEDVAEYEAEPPEQEEEVPPDFDDEVPPSFYDDVPPDDQLAQELRDLESLDNLSEIFSLDDSDDDAPNGVQPPLRGTPSGLPSGGDVEMGM